MVNITYVEGDGTRKTVSAKAGHSVMETALANGIKGITAECGGSLACATCHVFIDETSLQKIAAPVGVEDDMLDFAAVERRPESRLSCQIEITEDLENLVITIPETQV
ncbi:MAG: 2Fe-2S iron-sulfur cluster-binding protein [Sulfitobacter sp.]